MKHIDISIEYLIKSGQASLYYVKDESWLMLRIPSNKCCEKHTLPGYDVKMDKDGNIIDELPKGHTFTPNGVYNL